MLMADPAAALGETRRVLRDGGRLAASTWGDPGKNPWATISRAALAEHGHMEAPAPGTPGIFAISTQERMRELMTGAGFSNVDVEEVDLEFTFESTDDYWRFLNEIAGAVAIVLRGLGAEQLAAVRAAVDRGIEPYRANGAYVMPGTVLNAIAR
jgi:SAM-dependent methyltransferase